MEEPLFAEDAKASPTIPDIPCAVDDFDNTNGPAIGQMLEFWEMSREWLRLRGVRLYSLEPAPGRLACGQDSAGRDIMLKLVDNDSPQHHIFQTLLRHQSLFNDPRTFPGVLPPITIIDTPHRYSIWGANFCIQDMQDVRQVLTFIKCLLEGLSFLHANRIAHRDICDFNMVVSCYRPDRDHEKFGDDMRDLRRGDDVRYALMDYDQSIQLPLDVSVKDCRRPSNEAQMGWDLYKPLDVWLGESQYNPFAFDVGTLGNLFRVHFWEAVTMVPALPALFDGMTTHVLSRRFSAQEALDFFKGNIESPPEDVLDAPVTLQIDYEAVFNSELALEPISDTSTAALVALRELGDGIPGVR
ncbi:hypothetical protein V8D89_003274 [Ganoderma adspersum]